MPKNFGTEWQEPNIVQILSALENEETQSCQKSVSGILKITEKWVAGEKTQSTPLR